MLLLIVTIAGIFWFLNPQNKKLQKYQRKLKYEEENGGDPKKIETYKNKISQWKTPSLNINNNVIILSLFIITLWFIKDLIKK